MLDLTADTADDSLSSRTTEHAPVNDQALLDAYSNAVIGVTKTRRPGRGPRRNRAEGAQRASAGLAPAS